jgi:hypothetical protein
MELKRREFESVRQNDSPILRDVREFSELSQYAPDEVDTEEKRVKRFMKGLNPYMRMQLRLTGHHKFQELVDVAITLRMITSPSKMSEGRKCEQSQSVFQIESQHPT